MHSTEAIETNARGGQQSKLYTAHHLVDARAQYAMAAILHRGAIKYARDNWRLIPAEEHLNHALQHIYTWLETYRPVPSVKHAHPDLPLRPAEDELAHALCRVHMALAMDIETHGLHPEHTDPQYHEPQPNASQERTHP